MEVPRELIEQFVQLTNAGDSVATQLLGDSGLDLEAALTSFFAIQDAGGVPPSSPPAPRRNPSSSGAGASRERPATPPPVHDDEAMARALHESELAAADGNSDVRAPIPQRVDTLLPPEPRLPHGLGARRSRNTGPDPFGDSERLSQLFRPPQHLVFHGNMDAAMTEGVSSNRWILVNIQSVSEFSCHALNRDVWSDETLQELVRERFLFWQRDESSQDGNWYKQFHRFVGVPHIAIIDPRTGQRVFEFDSMSIPLTVADVMRALETFSDGNSLEMDTPPRLRNMPDLRGNSEPSSRAASTTAARGSDDMGEADEDDDIDEDLAAMEDAQLAAAIAESMETSEDGGVDREAPNLPDERAISRQISARNPTLNAERTLRAQQDSEYEASLALDRARAASIAAEEERQRNSRLAEEERKRNADAQREAKRRRVPAAPPEGAPNTTEVLVRLPSGAKLQRRFYASDSVGAVYDFVETETDEVADGQYDLMTPYPKNVLNDRALSLKDAGVYPKAMVVVHTR